MCPVKIRGIYEQSMFFFFLVDRFSKFICDETSDVTTKVIANYKSQTLLINPLLKPAKLLLVEILASDQRVLNITEEITDDNHEI